MVLGMIINEGSDCWKLLENNAEKKKRKTYATVYGFLSTSYAHESVHR